MIRVGRNYGQQGPCPLCRIDEDDQKHLLECIVLKIMCPAIMANMTTEYKDLFHEDVQKMERASKLIEEAVKMREELLEKKTKV